MGHSDRRCGARHCERRDRAGASVLPGIRGIPESGTRPERQKHPKRRQNATGCVTVQGFWAYL